MKKMMIINDSDMNSFERDVEDAVNSLEKNGIEIIDIKFSTCSRYDLNLTYSALIIYKEKFEETTDLKDDKIFRKKVTGTIGGE